jgi:hypothetical protein
MDRRTTRPGPAGRLAATSHTFVNRPEAFLHAFSALGAENTASLIAAAADVALLVDEGGIIRDVSIGNADLAELPHDDWIGKSWSETVTLDSRPKVEALLSDPGAGPLQRWAVEEAQRLQLKVQQRLPPPIAVDIIELPASYELTATVPGVTPSQLIVEVDDNVLHIRYHTQE